MLSYMPGRAREPPLGVRFCVGEWPVVQEVNILFYGPVSPLYILDSP